MKKALITGITAQDQQLSGGVPAAKRLVHGIIRRSSVDYRAHRPSGRPPQLHLHYGDLSDSMRASSRSLARSADEVQPRRQSHVQVSFDIAGVHRRCRRYRRAARAGAVRLCGWLTPAASTRITSELYGKVEEVPQNEGNPRSTPTAPTGRRQAVRLLDRGTARPTTCSAAPVSSSPRGPSAGGPCNPKNHLAAARIAASRINSTWGSFSPARLGLRLGLCRVHVADLAEQKPEDLVIAPVSSTRCVSSASWPSTMWNQAGICRRGHE